MSEEFRRLCRHAERFGTELVYETAEAFDHELIPFPLPLTKRELGYLARRLQEIDKRWHLDGKQQRRLFDWLAELGQSDREISTSCGISTRTARTWRNETSEPLEQAAKSVVK